MSEHRIVMVAIAMADGCARCSPTTPHNVAARCACRTEPPLMIASGRTDHIWTLQRAGDRGTLSPSFDWLIDPRDPSKGSHLHEFVVDVPIVSIGVLHGDLR